MRWLFALMVLAGCRELLGIDDGKPRADAAVDASDAPNYDGAKDAPSGCAADFVAVGGLAHRYMRITAPGDWALQRDTCTSKRGYLVVPDDATELQAITSFAANTAIWVGIDDVAGGGTYMTVLGSTATFLPWAAGEPMLGGNRNCVRVLANQQTYENDVCQTAEPTVCECAP